MRRYRIGRNEECLCGSGVKFKHCCIDYVGECHDIKRTVTEIEKGDFNLALKYCRADLTDYLINVKSHTEPLLVLKPSFGHKFLNVDIKAMSEILDRLMFIINTGKFDVDFIGLLDRLRNFFYNPKWHDRITYYKAAWIYFFENNEEAATEVLVNVSYKEIEDLDYLQMYFDLCSDELSFSQKQEVLDKLIGLEKKYSGKIQYTGIKGMEFLLIGDEGKAKELFDEAIELAMNNLDKFTDSYDFYQLGQVFHFAGRLLKNDKFLEKSIEYYIKSSEIEPMTKSGFSMVYTHIGDSYFALNDLDKALDYYFKSLDFEINPITKIFIAQIYIEKDEFEKAREVLDQLCFESLTKENKTDYLFVLSKLVILKRNNEKAKFACDELKKLTFDTKYFSDLSNQLITELLEIYKDFSSNEVLEQSRVKKLLSKLNEYCILQPNFNGIGFNFNSLFTDIIGKKK